MIKVSRKKWFDPQNIYETVRPIYCISRVFNVPPYTIRNGEILVTGFDYFLYLLWLSTYVYFLIVSVTGTDFTKLSYSRLTDNGPNFLVVFGLSVSGFILTVSGITRKACGKILRNLFNVDIKMKTLQISNNHKRECKFAIKFMAFYFFVVIMAIWFTFWNIKHCNNPFECFNIRIPLIIINSLVVVFMSHFVLLLMSVAHRFASLNEQFRKYFIPSSLGSQLSTSKFLSRTNHSEIISIFASAHAMLIDAVELINYCYTLQVMTSTATFFVFSLLGLFSTVKLIFNFDLESFKITMSYIVWGSFYNSFLLIAMFYGSYTTREGKLTGVLIHKAMTITRDESLKKELKTFSQQLLHRSAIVSCGLFPFDWTLLYSIVSATATYLVILIQFDITFGNIKSRNSTEI